MGKIDSNVLRAKINAALDNAEKHWNRGGKLLQKSLAVSQEAFDEAYSPSLIPGHPIVGNGETVIDEFVALVADMRDSSEHLLQAISGTKDNVSQLKRVYFETSALLTASGYTVEQYGGTVTEYLGDGLLALFQVCSESPKKSLYASHNAGKEIINVALPVINEILSERYSLPPLKVGVGLARSKALVTLVGYEDNLQPKVVGECIYRATKLSSGHNQVLIDKVMENSWPTSVGGKMIFTKVTKNTVTGYESK